MTTTELCVWLVCKHPKTYSLLGSILFLNPTGDPVITQGVYNSITTEQWFEMMNAKIDPQYWFSETRNPFNTPTVELQTLKTFLQNSPEYTLYFFSNEYNSIQFRTQNENRKKLFEVDSDMIALYMSLL